MDKRNVLAIGFGCCTNNTWLLYKNSLLPSSEYCILLNLLTYIDIQSIFICFKESK